MTESRFASPHHTSFTLPSFTSHHIKATADHAISHMTHHHTLSHHTPSPNHTTHHTTSIHITRSHTTRTPHSTTRIHTTRNHTTRNHTTRHHTQSHHTPPHASTPHHTSPHRITQHRTAPHELTTVVYAYLVNRFKDVPSPDGNAYSFNPCLPFNEGDQCQDSAVSYTIHYTCKLYI